MPLPKRRFSRSRRDKRRLHIHLTSPTTTACPNCGAVVVSHRICRSCGHYRGRQVVSIDKKQKGSA